MVLYYSALELNIPVQFSSLVLLISLKQLATDIMNSQQKQRDVRTKNFKQLREILITLCKYPSSKTHLCQDELTTIGIKRSEMNLQSENELDSGPIFCIPFPSDEIDNAFDKALVDDAYPEVGRPEWAPYTPDLQGIFDSAHELGRLLLHYLGCQSYDWDLIASTKWSGTA